MPTCTDSLLVVLSPILMFSLLSPILMFSLLSPILMFSLIYVMYFKSVTHPVWNVVFYSTVFVIVVSWTTTTYDSMFASNLSSA
jgi:hypothetical protein